ncbi:copper-binding periplasmic metallochaperone CueP [Buttiauxella agrestis]|uniref:Putative exported protein n=1 Tax=Buttiauxella agrestis ATCC 33320 TaxID=1006004 RepID=A0A085GBF5_9ENTR|nr:copper-binding periplasmic metallochaperone CueP [Buttiauxella agrestis]KFC81050.1 putative exported protein [Buttiauxella agrestis ATCC 33320]
MKRNILFALLALSISGSAIAAQSDAEFLAAHGLAGKTTEQMVEAIDGSTQARPLPYNAGITSTELKLSDGTQQFSYPLGDKFYLSFAPYLTQTHPCFNHSLSGCRGELANTPFEVKVTDKSGKILVQKSMTSHANGFVGVWLPRDIEGTIEVNYQGKTASAPIATHKDSQTCLTTLPLQG